MITTRRKLLFGLGATVAAPAIVGSHTTKAAEPKSGDNKLKDLVGSINNDLRNIFGEGTEFLLLVWADGEVRLGGYGKQRTKMMTEAMTALKNRLGL